MLQPDVRDKHYKVNKKSNRAEEHKTQKLRAYSEHTNTLKLIYEICLLAHDCLNNSSFSELDNPFADKPNL